MVAALSTLGRAIDRPMQIDQPRAGEATTPNGGEFVLSFSGITPGVGDVVKWRHKYTT